MVQVVARRPMTIAGQKLGAGDTIDASLLPPGRLRQLLDHGWAFETNTGGMAVVDSPAPGKIGQGNAFSCETCGKVLKSPQGVKLHQYRSHNSGRK